MKVARQAAALGAHRPIGQLAMRPFELGDDRELPSGASPSTRQDAMMTSATVADDGGRNTNSAEGGQ